MQSPEERDRAREDELDARRQKDERIDRFTPIARDTAARATAEKILTTPLEVHLTPRQLGRLIGLVAADKGHWIQQNEHEEAGDCEEILARLTRAVAQIGARP